MPISLDEYEAQFGGAARSPVPQGQQRAYGWGDRLGASVDSAQAGLLGVGEAMGIDSWADARRRNQFEGDYVRQASIRDTGAPTSFGDTFSSPSNFAKGVAGLAIDSAPQLATSLAAGVVGGSVAGFGTLGRLGLAAAAGAPFNMGDILQNQRSEAGTTDLLSAAALTVPYTAADMLGLDAALARGSLMKSGIRYLDDMKGPKGYLARGGVNTGINSLAEGTGETLQEFANQAGRIAVNPDQTMFNPEANDRYLESFGGGALLGGGLAAPFSMGRSAGYIQKPGEQTPAAASPVVDMLAPNAPPAAPAAPNYGDPVPYAPLTEAELAMLKAENLPGQLGEGAPNRANAYGNAIDFEPGVGENAGLFADPAPTTGARRGLVTEMSPLQQRIDQNLGIGGPRVAQGDYVKQFTSAANEPTGVMRTGTGDNSGNEVMDTALEATQRSAGILDQERILAEQAKADAARKVASKTRAKDLTGRATDKAAETVEMLDKAMADRKISTQEHTDAVNGIAIAKSPKQVQDAYKAARALVEGKQSAAPAAPSNQAAAPAGQAPATAAAPTGVSAATGQPAPAVQPAAASSTPAAPAAVAPTPPAGAKGTKAGASVVNKLTGKTAVIGGSIDFSMLKMALEQLDPRLHHAVRLTLGIDKDGNKLDKPLSAKAAAAQAGMGENNGALVSRASNALGIDKAARDRFTASDAMANESAEGDIGDGSEAPVKRLAEETVDRTEADDKDLTFNQAGMGVVGNVGQSQGKVESAGKGLITAQPWYKIVREKGLDGLKPVELGAVAHEATRYADNPNPENKAALSAIMDAIRAVQRDPEKRKEWQRGWDKAENGGTVDRKSDGGSEEGASGSGPDGGLSDADGEDNGEASAGRTEEAGSRTPVVTVKPRRVIQKSKAADGPIAVSVKTTNGTLEIKDAQKAVDKLQDTIERFRNLIACLGRA
jgi:hypothetical protein